MLAKALAHYFEAKLLLLDATDFSLKASLCCCSLLVLFFFPFFSFSFFLLFILCVLISEALVLCRYRANTVQTKNL
jgi:uncharacterized protein (DUF2062 family)